MKMPKGQSRMDNPERYWQHCMDIEIQDDDKQQKHTTES